MRDTPFPACYPRVDAPLIRRLGGVLRPFLLGLFFVIIDITYTVPGTSFDILHDSIGYGIMLVGAYRLRTIVDGAGSAVWVAYITTILWLSMADAVLRTSAAWEAVPVVRDLLDLARTVAFGACFVIIRRVCRRAMAFELVRCWNRAFYCWLAVIAAPTVAVTLWSFVVLAAWGPPKMVVVPSGPFIVAFVLCELATILLVVYAATRTLRWTPPGRVHNCHVCGYALDHITKPQCTECGALFATERGSIAVGHFPGGAGGAPAGKA
ncbi:MAG: hypothetical protein IPJ41_09815 [Phycisphaerales bacterium]|nr:hypothetical protein [Phycisphaerales bacterium]